jgi:predicted TIM-barrel fold metal-dependent hydrolase
MRIVDAQVHIWSGGTPLAHHRQVASLSAGEMLKEMDAAGVDAAIIHPPSWDANSNAVAIEAARKYPNRFAILGQFPPEKPESRGLIANWNSQPGMLGLRWALTYPHQKDWPSDGTMDWIWPEAERAGVPVALLARRFLPAFRRVAEAHPRLRLILDHCGLHRAEKDAAAFAGLDDLLALARLPNVAVKATGAPGYSTAPYPYRNIHDGLRRIFDAFGPARFFWGTDITRMPCSYRQCVTMFTEELSWLTGKDLEMVMGRGVCEWLGWEIEKP